MYDQAVDLIVF